MAATMSSLKKHYSTLLTTGLGSRTSPEQSSYLAGFSKRTVRSTTETFGVGTRKAIPCCAVHGKVLPCTEASNGAQVLDEPAHVTPRPSSWPSHR